jgi:hypothetical protein
MTTYCSYFHVQRKGTKDQRSVLDLESTMSVLFVLQIQTKQLGGTGYDRGEHYRQVMGISILKYVM